MAESLEHRDQTEYRFLVPCRTVTPLSCSANSSKRTDSDLRRDSQGRLVVPGTSIAGVLRTAVERISGKQSCAIYKTDVQSRRDPRPCRCPVCTLFGEVHPGAKVDGDEQPGRRQASRVTVYDAVLEPSDGESHVRSRVVDSVMIHRTRRSASDAKKFDYAEVLPGSKLTVELRVEGPTEQELEWLGTALRMLGDGSLPIGGRSARGSGRLQADTDSAEIRFRNLSDRDDLLASLLHEEHQPESWPRLLCRGLENFPALNFTDDAGSIRFVLRAAPETTFLVADPVAALETGFDHAPRGGVETPELPASSLRGCLRSAANRIVRTILLDGSDREGDDHPFIQRLFGGRDKSSRVTVQVLRRDTESTPAPFDHVAIDRFTGGASDQRKFNTMASRGGEFDVTLAINHYATADEREWMVGLLVLALSEIHTNRTSIGYGAARGHGGFRVVAPDWGDFDLQRCIDALWKEVSPE